MRTRDTEVAQQIAQTLIEGFDRHYWLFRETSALAKQRFEDADWAEAQSAVRERISFYDERVRECVARLSDELGADRLDDETWQQAKLLYIGLLVEHKRPELAETFFNSVVTRMLHRTYRHNDFIFVRSAVSTEYIESDPPIYRSYYPEEGELRETIVGAIRAIGWSRPFADLARDSGFVMQALLEHLGRLPAPEPNFQLQVLSSAFYRNKAAFVIGRIVNGHDETPFVIPVLHDPEGHLVLDTVILDPEEISILFSLSRSYFMAEMDVPSGTVEFLQAIMPAKPRSELYTAIGLGKQGKTLFYRDLRQHLHHSNDLFVEAPGTPGQVMHVFHLPSYPYVLKVIKDVFGPTKTTDRETVKRKFLMVKEVDRVGRMADAVEFTELALPLDRFAPELLEQLRELASSVIEVEDESLVLHHCYVERRMTPLNLYLETATDEQLEAAVLEYGNAIRELAIANVFPGDMLWRNFGLTRYGRVVFYDYDELMMLEDVNFRVMPVPVHPEDEMAAEPWFGVDEADVFPEEFRSFLGVPALLRRAFEGAHGDLFEAETWQSIQNRISAGEIIQILPYEIDRRLRDDAPIAA